MPKKHDTNATVPSQSHTKARNSKKRQAFLTTTCTRPATAKEADHAAKCATHPAKDIGTVLIDIGLRMQSHAFHLTNRVLMTEVEAEWQLPEELVRLRMACDAFEVALTSYKEAE